MKRILVLLLLTCACASAQTNICASRSSVQRIAITTTNYPYDLPESFYTNAVCWYPFDEDDGLAFTDMSYAHTDGTTTGSPTYNVNQYVEYDGTNMIFAGGWGDFNTLENLTWTVRLYCTDFADFRSVVSVAEQGASTGRFVWWRLEANGVARIFIRTDTGAPSTTINAYTANNAIPANTWFWLTLTLGDSGNGMYLNGAPLALTYITGNAGTTTCLDDITGGDLRIEIGTARYNGDAVNYLDNADLEQFQMYDRSLTAAEIAAEW
jgi:hypothetical protein